MLNLTRWELFLLFFRFIIRLPAPHASTLDPAGDSSLLERHTLLLLYYCKFSASTHIYHSTSLFFFQSSSLSSSSTRHRKSFFNIFFLQYILSSRILFPRDIPSSSNMADNSPPPLDAVPDLVSDDGSASLTSSPSGSEKSACNGAAHHCPLRQHYSIQDHDIQHDEGSLSPSSSSFSSSSSACRGRHHPR